MITIKWYGLNNLSPIKITEFYHATTRIKVVFFHKFVPSSRSPVRPPTLGASHVTSFGGKTRALTMHLFGPDTGLRQPGQGPQKQWWGDTSGCGEQREREREREREQIKTRLYPCLRLEMSWAAARVTQVRVLFSIITSELWCLLMFWIWRLIQNDNFKD